MKTLKHTELPIPLAALLFYAATTVWLILYLTLAHRYNGGDYLVYVDAVERLLAGLSPYRFDEGSSFHYSPIGLLPFLAVRSLPLFAQHLLIFLLSWIALLRMTYLTVKLLVPLPGPASRQWVLWIMPWLLVHQGIGFQFESGNINLILIYLMTEGFYQIVQKNSVLGFCLLLLPALFKPAFGLVPYFLFLSRAREFLLPCLKAAAVLVLFALLPFMIWGLPTGITFYKEWWQSNAAHTHVILSGEIVNANLSLLSFAYEKLHLSVNEVLLYVFLPPFVAIPFVLPRLDLRDVFAVAMTFLFLFSPATFPYSILGLLFPAAVGLRHSIVSPTPLQWALLGLFTVGMVFLNVNFMGRELYNGVAVPLRLQGFAALALLPILMGGRFKSNA